MTKSDKNKKIKCVIWDLDNTIWNGVLVEDKNVVLREDILNIITELDKRGTLNSIASKNIYELAMGKLREFGIAEYFLFPQISWQPKSDSIKQIANLLNIGMDAIAFVDDEQFEREEVKFNITEILCIDPLRHDILQLEELSPDNITVEAVNRRKLYLDEIARSEDEKNFKGTGEDFLSTLELQLTICKAQEQDLERARELTLRTHQLNTTGYAYTYEELDHFRQSLDHVLIISSLEDKYGDYGKIGLTLLELSRTRWTIKLFLISCRVMSRGIGTVILSHILETAKESHVNLFADYVPNDKNRVMYVTYKFAGFKEVTNEENIVVMQNDLTAIQPIPKYIKLNTEGFLPA